MKYLKFVMVFFLFISCGKKEEIQPNILFIMTDQQSAEMLSCAGNKYLHTPALDRLAARGIRFELGYSPNPVCVPSRTAMVTGLYPSVLALGRNEDAGRLGGEVPQEVKDHTIGTLLKKAGYDCFFGGKTHWVQGLNYENTGFENLTYDYRDTLAEKCVDLLNQAHTKPFFLVASFMNPRDICYHILDRVAEKYGTPKIRPESKPERALISAALASAEKAKQAGTFDRDAPPLPANAKKSHHMPLEDFQNPAAKPDPNKPGPLDIYYYERLYSSQQMTAEDWRLYSWVYHRLTEDVDRQIGLVLDALKATGLEDNTLVVFTSDHGEMNGAHGKVAKNSFYDESSRVPFLMAGPGVQKGKVDRSHFIATSTDLIPTFCAYAGIAAPTVLHGQSLRQIAEGKEVENKRKLVVAEGNGARMLRSKRFKYINYGTDEVLFDMENDPGEMYNLAGQQAYAAQVSSHRAKLNKWVTAQIEPLQLKYKTTNK